MPNDLLDHVERYPHRRQCRDRRVARVVEPLAFDPGALLKLVPVPNQVASIARRTSLGGKDHAMLLPRDAGPGPLGILPDSMAPQVLRDAAGHLEQPAVLLRLRRFEGELIANALHGETDPERACLKVDVPPVQAKHLPWRNPKDMDSTNKA